MTEEPEIRSEMTEQDWEDIRDSDFVDIAEGVSSFALIFEDEDGLHGFQVKHGSKKTFLQPKAFDRIPVEDGEEE